MDNLSERWTPSYYSVGIRVDSPISSAWTKLLDYRAWNPSFEGANVKLTSGTLNTAGERVLITKTAEYINGEIVPAFIAETVVLDHERRQVVWYVYPTEGRLFRNFVDFRLVPEGSGARFEISYCEQNQLEGEALASHRVHYQADLKATAEAFKAWCEDSR